MLGREKRKGEEGGTLWRDLLCDLASISSAQCDDNTPKHLLIKWTVVKLINVPSLFSL